MHAGIGCAYVAPHEVLVHEALARQRSLATAPSLVELYDKDGLLEDSATRDEGLVTSSSMQQVQQVQQEHLENVNLDIVNLPFHLGPGPNADMLSWPPPATYSFRDSNMAGFDRQVRTPVRD